MELPKRARTADWENGVLTLDGEKKFEIPELTMELMERLAGYTLSLLHIWHGPVEPVAAVSLIFGVGLGVFLQEIAEQVVVGVNVRVFFQTLGPVGLEGRLGLDVRDTTHPGVYAKAKILVLSQFLVQILVRCV